MGVSAKPGTTMVMPAQVLSAGLLVFFMLALGLSTASLADVTVNPGNGSQSSNTGSTIQCPSSGGPNRSKYFEVCDASSHLEDGVLLLQARLYFGLSAAVKEALNSGVPITIQIRVDIMRRRRFMWDETIASLSQKYRLQYHNLSQQYILTNINTKFNSIFQTSQSAFELISKVQNYPLIDKKLLSEKESYYGQVRIKLAIGDLPSPLRLWAYMSSDWRLKSEWFQWQL